MSVLPVYILAGGRSSRFGSDKARATIDGRPMVQRLAEAAKPVAASVTIVAETPGKYDDLGLSTIADEVPGRGPLGGLHAALGHMREPGWLLLLSCDLAELRVAWVDTLVAHARKNAQVVAFRSDDRWQPLLAMYHTSIEPAVEQQLAGSQFAMQTLLHKVETIEAPRPNDWPAILQVNTRDDWDKAFGSGE